MCRMCRFFDEMAPGQCAEDDAEDVKEKELANFCEYFEPTAGAFDPHRKSEADRAREALEALFAELEKPK
ncbi:MAG: hypothetical protein R3348_02620 [Xanthomonadales bacterium]|nr:hypothetical protein [Xanthomonadales bacterium]